MYAPTSTDLRHFLEEDGSLAELSPQAGRLYRYCLHIVQGVVADPEGVVVPTGVGCRRRPGRRPCPGGIVAVWEHDDGVVVTWECSDCGDSGRISGIPDHMWDELEDIVIEFVDDDEFDRFDGSGGESRESVLPAASLPEFTAPAQRLWENLDAGTRIMILNQVHCVSCPRPVSMQLQTARVAKGDILLNGRCLNCGGPVARHVEMG